MVLGPARMPIERCGTAKSCHIPRQCNSQFRHFPASDNQRRSELKVSEHILKLPAVKDRVGLSRSTIYDMIARHEFPAPIKLGARAVGWIESEIEQWLEQRIHLRKTA